MEREDTKKDSREAGGEGGEGQADKRMELGLEHPGKQRTRTGTSGGRKPWTGTSGEAGLHKEEDAAAARSGKESMNKSKERGRDARIHELIQDSQHTGFCCFVFSMHIACPVLP